MALVGEEEKPDLMSRLLQRVQSKVKADASPGVEEEKLVELKRPRCMEEGLPVLQADVQLPPKPRGRKPAKDKNKRSAAACPSAAGPAEKEIEECLKDSKAKGSERTGKSKKRQAQESDEVVPEPKRRSRKCQAQESDAVDPEPKRKSKKCQAQESDAVDPEPKCKSKKRHAQESDAVDPEPKCKSKKRQGSDAVDPEPKCKHPAVDEEDSEAENAGGAGGASKPDSKADKKAQLSRKSAAYHKAVRSAKNRGLTEAAAKKLGKQAPCPSICCGGCFCEL